LAEFTRRQSLKNKQENKAARGKAKIMKPLQHAQISQKIYGGKWTDYVEIHSFLDSSKAACAHFKHRFLLHHQEGIEWGVKIFGEQLINSENRSVSTRRILTDHLIEDLGKVATIDDWAGALFPDKNDSFYRFLARRRELIDDDNVKGEHELLRAFNLKQNDTIRIKSFLNRPLENSAHPAALLVTHNSFGIFLAEKIFGCAFVKEREKNKERAGSKQQFIATREVFERLVFLRLKSVPSPFEILTRTAAEDWMRGDQMAQNLKEKKRSAVV
jgi:hypothetical protein